MTGALRVAQRRLNRDLVLVLLSAAIVCAHPLLNLLFPGPALSISYVFFLGANVFAFAACLWRAIVSPGMRAKWGLVAAGLLLWLMADTMDGITVFVHHAEPVSATLKDFIYFFYGIPLLIAIAMPEEGEETIPLFLVLDALQALAVGYLIYAVIFSVLPFSSKPEEPIPETLMNLVYDIENVALALLAAARLAFHARSRRDHQFFQVLAGFLWAYGICIFAYNHLLGDNTTIGWLDVLVTVPFVVMTLGALLADKLPVHGTQSPPSRHISLTLDNARPILLSLALVTLCAIVAHHHLSIAVGFTLGAFTIYGIRSIILQNRFQRTQIALEQARDQLAEMALQDGLTGVANRRCFDQRLASEWNRAHRLRYPLALMLIDVDHFKHVNDTHGHLIGDECLKHIAQSLRAALHRASLHRSSDLVARYGGEEFAILLPETGSGDAILLADSIRETLAQTTPLLAGLVPITVSIGVAAWESSNEVSPEHILDTADKALYSAKQNGRNRVEFQQIEPLAAK